MKGGVLVRHLLNNPRREPSLCAHGGSSDGTLRCPLAPLPCPALTSRSLPRAAHPSPLSALPSPLCPALGHQAACSWFAEVYLHLKAEALADTETESEAASRNSLLAEMTGDV